MKVLKVSFSGRGGLLEGCLDLPGSPGRVPGVVLCHPHPLYGGNMDNNVIVAVSRALTGAGSACLRFNFRGVGRSRGSFADGRGEQEDAGSALEFLSSREEIDPGRIAIMGYSFGGMVAMGAGEGSGAALAIAAVSPVITPGALRECLKPKYIICGGADELVSSAAVLREAGRMAEPKKADVIPGADHFWWGYEEEMAGRVAAFLTGIFNQEKSRGMISQAVM